MSLTLSPKCLTLLQYLAFESRDKRNKLYHESDTLNRIYYNIKHTTLYTHQDKEFFQKLLLQETASDDKFILHALLVLVSSTSCTKDVWGIEIINGNIILSSSLKSLMDSNILCLKTNLVSIHFTHYFHTTESDLIRSIQTFEDKLTVQNLEDVTNIFWKYLVLVQCKLTVTDDDKDKFCKIHTNLSSSYNNLFMIHLYLMKQLEQNSIVKEILDKMILTTTK